MTDDELRGALAAPDEVRGLQVLTLAMVAGALLLLMVTVVLHATSPAGELAAGEDDLSLFLILSGVNAVLFASAWTLGFGIYRFLTRDLARAASAYELWSRLRSAAILRLALLEGSALFGVAVCLLGVVQGAATGRPWIWANAAPAVLFSVLTILTFPTAERLVRQHSARAGWS